MDLPKLLNKYYTLTPSFLYVTNKYLNNNYTIDHIAQRCVNSSLLLHYQRNNFILQPDVYNFPRFNVQANWLKPINIGNTHECLNFRIFISHYKQKCISKIFTYKDYLDIYEKNQYLAWTLLHKNDINHIAINVNDIEGFYEKLKDDCRLKISTDNQISKDKKLKQFSLQADKLRYNFSNGTYEVPYTFVEFIQRIDNRDGFESENADKIFDSTKIN